MTWPFGSRAASTPEGAIEEGRSRRTGGGATGSVSAQQAMRLSVMWACRRLRADLISTMPVDVYRRVRVGDQMVQVEVPKPKVMISPGGKRIGWQEWVYSTQMDLDAHGNTFGVIEEVDANGLPSEIRLAPAASASVREDKRTRDLTFTLGGSKYSEAEVWHEKQHTIPGCPVGLSPIAYAALSLNTALEATEYAATWFGNGARPAAHLRNTAMTLDATDSRKTKERFVEQVADGDVFVSGKDWEYKLIDGKASEAMFLEQIEATNLDICRFLGVPGDMVDVSASGQNVTYANITQRNLQLLIMNLNPALLRRERAWSDGLLPAPRYAKANRGVLLQMDAKTRAETNKIAIDSRTLSVDEARELEDRAPLTEEQEAQFARLFGSKNAQPPTTVVPPPSS